MIGSIVRHHSYIAHDPRFLPIAIVVILGIIGFMCMMAVDVEGLLLGAIIIACIAIPVFTMRWQNSYLVHSNQIQLIDRTSGVKVWVPAIKQPDGTWWPIGGKRVKEIKKG
jgi:hypothetical protein